MEESSPGAPWRAQQGVRAFRADKGPGRMHSRRTRWQAVGVGAAVADWAAGRAGLCRALSDLCGWAACKRSRGIFCAVMHLYS